MEGEIEDKFLFRTSGPGCHWCGTDRTRAVWGPYGTNVCDYCEGLLEQGREWEVAETVAARITVRGNWRMLDPENWRKRESALIAHWLSIRTERTEVPLGKPRCESEWQLDALGVLGCALVYGHDGLHRAEIDGHDYVTARVEWPVGEDRRNR